MFRLKASILLLVVPTLVVAAGCNIFDPFDILGDDYDCDNLNCAIVWYYGEELTDESGEITCVIDLVEQPSLQNPALGSLSNVNQSGSTFSGRLARNGTCQTPGGEVSYGEQHTFSNGSVVSNEIAFDTPTCQFEGTFSGHPPDVMEGSLTCSIPELGGQTVIGTWHTKGQLSGGTL